MTGKSSSFHIGKDNKPAPCSAKKEKCPLGGNTPHFESKEQANSYVEKKLSAEKAIYSSKQKPFPSPAAMPVKKFVPTVENKKPKTHNRKTHVNVRNANRANKESSVGNKNKVNSENNERKYFSVVGKLETLRNLDENNSTYHKSAHRKQRMQAIEESCGKGEVVAQFIIDKKHRNGNEIHQVKSNGCIDVYNERTGRHITTLIARPKQVERCYNGVGEKIPKELLMKTISNTAKGYNHL